MVNLTPIYEAAKRLVECTMDLEGHGTIGQRGFLVFTTAESSQPYCFSIGRFVDPDTLRSYRERALEQAQRLRKDFERDPAGTMSSWQTRDPNQGKYGGAIIVRSTPFPSTADIFSFAGIREDVNEAIATLTPFEAGLLDNREKKYVDRIAEISKNKVIPDLRKLYQTEPAFR